MFENLKRKIALIVAGACMLSVFPVTGNNHVVMAEEIAEDNNTIITTAVTTAVQSVEAETTNSENEEVEVLFEEEESVCGLKYTVTSDGVLTVDRASDGYFDTYLECLELIVNENLGIKDYSLTNNQIDLEEYDELVTTIKFTDNVKEIPNFIFATSLVEITPLGERLEIDGKNSFPSLETVILSDISQLGNYCFYGLKIENIIIPSEYKELYGIDMNYNNIYIYNSEVEIKDSEYSITQTAVIYGYENSTAYDYAKKYGRTFYAFDKAEPLLTVPAVTTTITTTTNTTNTTTTTTTATTTNTTSTSRILTDATSLSHPTTIGTETIVINTVLSTTMSESTSATEATKTTITNISEITSETTKSTVVSTEVTIPTSITYATTASNITTSIQATSITTTTTIELTKIIGDANNDNELNVRDCAYIASMLANLKGDKLTQTADFNGDGVVNVRDAAAIARKIATVTYK